MENLDISIKLDAHGHGMVLVNGEDWSNRVQAIQLNSTAQTVTLVNLTVWATSLEFEAPAEVQVIHAPSEGEAEPSDG